MIGQTLLKVKLKIKKTGCAVTVNEYRAEEPMKICAGSLIHSDDKIKAITLVQLYRT